MTSIQINIRTTPFLAKELDHIIEEGYFRNRTEAINEGIRVVIRQYQLENVRTRINNIRPKDQKYNSSKKLIRDVRNEEDQ